MNHRIFWILYIASIAATFGSGLYVAMSSAGFWSIPFFLAFVILLILAIEAYTIVKPHRKKHNENS